MVRICEHVGKKAPGGRQTLLVSATLTPRVLQMCAPWCANPRQVFVGTAPAAAAAAEAEAAAEAGQAAQRAERAQQAQRGEAGMEGQERRPAWGWGDAKSPSADAADYFPGQCPGRLEHFEVRRRSLHGARDLSLQSMRKQNFIRPHSLPLFPHRHLQCRWPGQRGGCSRLHAAAPAPPLRGFRSAAQGRHFAVSPACAGTMFPTMAACIRECAWSSV